MHTWFQNLNENGRRWFDFRGLVGSNWEKTWFSYQLCSGPSLRLSAETRDDENKISFTFGLICFSLYLSIHGFPRTKKRREWGFYVHEWTVNAFFGRNPWESGSRDPWYYNIRFDLPLIAFGKQWHFEDERLKAYSPVLFEYRGKQYQMDEIRITDSYWFRSRVPFGLFRRKVKRMHLEIKDPPKHAGKGENSWDCGDDGCWGMTATYRGPAASWANSDEVFKWCCLKYCEDTSGYIKRYGRASGDEVPHDVLGFKYIGRKRDPNEPTAYEAKP